MSRNYRRAMLSLLLAAVGTSVSAAQPTVSDYDSGGSQARETTAPLTVRMLPPLPLAPIKQVAGTSVQTNPFCGDLDVQVDPLIQLASGDEVASVRLKPIGAVIGLHPIGSPKAANNEFAAMTIETPPPPPVRTNPMITSAHHENRDLVAAKLVGKNSPTVSDSSQLMFRPPAKIQACGSAEAESQAVETAELIEGESAGNRQPIFFSMSDEDDSMPADVLPESIVIDRGSEYSEEEIGMLKQMLAGEAGGESLENPDASELQPDGPSERIRASTPAKPIAIDLVPNVDESYAIGKDSRAENLRKKRYRSPVDVKAPPLAADRGPLDPTASIVRPVVKSVVAPRLDESQTSPAPRIVFGAEKQPTSLAEAGKPVSLYMDLAQVSSLTIDGELRRVSIQDPDICRAFTSGTNQIKLIGAGNGVTRLVVWADTAAGTPTKVRQFDIHVQDAANAATDSVGDNIGLLNRTIAKTFPEARVNVQMVDAELVISGDCGSETSARQIVRMVRKACLVPVRDELGVR